MTALAAVGGCLVALYAQEAGEVAFISNNTAGGFIYIATVSVIPDLLKGYFKQSVGEIVSLLMGVAMMLWIA